MSGSLSTNPMNGRKEKRVGGRADPSVGVSRPYADTPIRVPRRYPFRKASRSALMVSASVVGMPCGKP
jgi:hypothetical protein